MIKKKKNKKTQKNMIVVQITVLGIEKKRTNKEKCILTSIKKKKVKLYYTQNVMYKCILHAYPYIYIYTMLLIACVYEYICIYAYVYRLMTNI